MKAKYHRINFFAGHFWESDKPFSVNFNVEPCAVYRVKYTVFIKEKRGKSYGFCSPNRLRLYRMIIKAGFKKYRKHSTTLP